MPFSPLSETRLWGNLRARVLRLTDNGLTVLLLADRAAPVVAYQTWFGVGSRHEQPGKTGLAHLFEHLMFNQTERLDAGEFDRRIEAAGGDTNAATWVDWTHYRDNIASDRLALLVELEADRMAGLVLRDEQVASEKEVVANERRYSVEDDIDGFLGERLYALAFAAHPYRRPTIGWMDDILALTPEDCRGFYRTWYAPNNATLVVAGDLDEQATLDGIESAYRAIPAFPLPAEERVTEPPPAGERRARFRKPVATERALVAWPGPALADPAHPVFEVLHEVLLGGRSSRLYRALVESELCGSAGGSLDAFRDPGLYQVDAALRAGRRAEEAVQAVAREVAALAAAAPADGELARARARLEAGFLWELRSAEGKAQALGHHQVTAGDLSRLCGTLEAWARVSAEDVRRAAATLRDEVRVVLAVEPGDR